MLCECHCIKPIFLKLRRTKCAWVQSQGFHHNTVGICWEWPRARLLQWLWLWCHPDGDMNKPISGSWMLLLLNKDGNTWPNRAARDFTQRHKVRQARRWEMVNIKKVPTHHSNTHLTKMLCVCAPEVPTLPVKLVSAQREVLELRTLGYSWVLGIWTEVIGLA